MEKLPPLLAGRIIDEHAMDLRKAFINQLEAFVSGYLKYNQLTSEDYKELDKLRKLIKTILTKETRPYWWRERDGISALKILLDYGAEAREQFINAVNQ